MENNNIIRWGAFSAIGVTAYTTAIGWLFIGAERFLASKPDTILAPISLLTLLVLSVGIVGCLIFLRPVLMYLDGKKVEAVKLIVATLGWLALFTLVLFIFQVLL